MKKWFHRVDRPICQTMVAFRHQAGKAIREVTATTITRLNRYRTQSAQATKAAIAAFEVKEGDEYIFSGQPNHHARIINLILMQLLEKAHINQQPDDIQTTMNHASTELKRLVEEERTKNATYINQMLAENPYGSRSIPKKDLSIHKRRAKRRLFLENNITSKTPPSQHLSNTTPLLTPKRRRLREDNAKISHTQILRAPKKSKLTVARKKLILNSALQSKSLLNLPCYINDRSILSHAYNTFGDTMTPRGDEIPLGPIDPTKLRFNHITKMGSGSGYAKLDTLSAFINGKRRTWNVVTVFHPENIKKKKKEFRYDISVNNVRAAAFNFLYLIGDLPYAYNAVWLNGV